MKAHTIPIAGVAVAALLVTPVAAARSDVPAVGETGGPLRPLTFAEWQQWLRGREVFDRDFTQAEGLGTPELNADSCRACHQDPVLGGAGGLELNVSRYAFDDDGQGPFQNLPNGQVASKLRPPLTPGRDEHEPTADVFEQRQTPIAFGIGLIQSISEATILSHEDPADQDGDGIRGVARMVPIGGPGGPLEVGRFGWKAQVPRVADFARDAMGGECGITTPDDGRGFAFLFDTDSVGDPELSQGDLDDLVFFLELLGPPARGGSSDPRVDHGEFLFERIGCALCHVPSLPGSGGPVHLYSNLLLHDVMPAGFRGMDDPGAGAGMFRTPPLWGVSHTAPFMHDGRASTLRAAIEAHDGEAAAVRGKFQALSPEDQTALILFLEDL